MCCNNNVSWCIAEPVPHLTVVRLSPLWRCPPGFMFVHALVALWWRDGFIVFHWPAPLLWGLARSEKDGDRLLLDARTKVTLQSYGAADVWPGHLALGLSLVFSGETRLEGLWWCGTWTWLSGLYRLGTLTRPEDDTGGTTLWNVAEAEEEAGGGSWLRAKSWVMMCWMMGTTKPDYHTHHPIIC